MKIHEGAAGPYERVVWAHDDDTGLRAIVAVHSTALGPAVGGTRFFPYPDEPTAMIDVLRLSVAMTLKAAAAGLDLGGGKAVIIGDPRRLKCASLLEAYGRVVDALDGDYVTAEDVGTTLADMDMLRRCTPYVVGTSAGGGDPSPFTARGVVAAMRAAWEHDSGAPDLRGVRVVVQGAGKVGAEVARLLIAEGALVGVSDVRADAIDRLAALGAVAIPPDRALVTPCDVLAPCALGGVIDAATAPALCCRWVVGSANNQLATDDLAAVLHERGIGYVPDFIVNAGGLIAVCDELHGFDPERVARAVDRIGDLVRDLLEESRDEGETPLAGARRRAAARLAGVGVGSRRAA